MLYKKSALEISNMIKERKVSAEEVLKDSLNRIKQTDKKIGSFLYVDEEKSIIKAREIDYKVKNNDDLSCLAGVVISIKDNISVKGMQNTCASKMLENYISPYNATVINKIEDNDLVIVGKTNLDEFAMGSSTETSVYKKTRNPYDLERVPGGSSGGSATSVSSGQTFLSLGSDTGGSIRQPASYCGILGFKPTYGSVSRYGLVAYSSSFDQIGPFSRTTEDMAAILSTIYGEDEMDATTVNTNFSDYKSLLNVDTKKLKIALPKEYFSDEVSEDVRNSLTNCIKELEKVGATFKEISIPIVKYAIPAYYSISCSESSSNLARFDGVKYGYRSEEYDSIEEMYINSRSEGFGDEVKRRIIMGSIILGSENEGKYYNNAKNFQRKIKSEFNAIFNEFDLILTPTVPGTAFKFGENANPLQMYLQDICTVTSNICGVPSISIPCGFDRNNLPIGLQLIGNDFRDDLLLSTSLKIEKILGGFNKISNI